MKKIIFIVFICSVFLLSGCAENASPRSMASLEMPKTKIKNSSLLHAISIGTISGGHETNPMWVSEISNDGFQHALEESLQFTHLYANEKPKYQLNAELLSLNQPLAGFDITVSSTVHYSLINLASKKSVYDNYVESKYTAKFSDNYIGVVRIKMANEGVARENIRALINDLYALH